MKTEDLQKYDMGDLLEQFEAETARVRRMVRSFQQQIALLEKRIALKDQRQHELARIIEAQNEYIKKLEQKVLELEKNDAN